MVCQVCHQLVSRPLCRDCVGGLKPAADRILPSGVRLVAAYEHEGPARVLMHHLKYRGVTTYAEVAAAAIRDRLPDVPVVPVPRVWSRRVKYGVDPAFEIAKRLNRPVLPLLGAPVHAPRRAGGDHRRPAPALRLRDNFHGQVAVVDDVVTSGATLHAAIESLGRDRVALAVAANAAINQMSSSARRPAARASE